VVSGPFRKGDVVEVRQPREILATLDEQGALEGLPFMPEMVAFCGRQFEVVARADKVCDTVTKFQHLSRRVADSVLLKAVRCDGGFHDGCQADCLIYWKEAWLRRIEGPAATATVSPADCEALMARVAPHVTRVREDGDRTYRCQATEAVAASTALSTADPRPYVRECTSGNVRLGKFVTVMGRAISAHARNKLGRLPNPPLRGTEAKSPSTSLLGLEPGDWVRVKDPDEIAVTLNDKGMNKGLWFDREMEALCGQVFQVRQRVNRFINETDGTMIELKSDCITLEGAVCSGEYSLSRWFCPRAIHPYWREGWLERVDAPAS